jgi:hypothetical protein
MEELYEAENSQLVKEQFTIEYGIDLNWIHETLGNFEIIIKLLKYIIRILEIGTLVISTEMMMGH